MNLRYIIRNGKEVLQQYTDGEITNWGVLHGCWTDVPLVRAEPEKLSPENKKLVRAVVQELETTLFTCAETAPVAEQTVTVTRERLAETWDCYLTAENKFSGSYASRTFKEFCRALGFKDE
jgi:hypothetical protein